MDFGAVPNPEGLELNLPEDAPLTADTLLGAEKRPLEVYAGLPILANAGYVGRLYPKGTANREYFRLYSQRFNTLEFNTTHYGIPKHETVDHWYQSVPDGFRYCPKIPQSISHVPDLNQTDKDRDLFLTAISRLKNRLGTQFIQFPPQFGPERLLELIAFVERWPAEYPLAIELRAPEWFEPHHQAWSALLEVLQTQGVGLVITDVAGRRDVLHMTLTIPEVLVRFNGYGLHSSDFERTNEWIVRLRRWQSQGLQRIYFFQHQPHPPNSLDMMQHTVQEWNKGGSPSLQVPRLQNPNAQQSLF